MKKRKIENNHKFKTHKHEIIFWRIFFFETRHNSFFAKRFRNIFVHKFDKKNFLTKNQIQKLMKNYFRDITSKFEIINDKQHEIEQHFRLLSKPHEKNIRFLFMKIRSCLYERYNRLFSWFRNSFVLFRWNISIIEKI